jgi:hypothetical protein
MQKSGSEGGVFCTEYMNCEEITEEGVGAKLFCRDGGKDMHKNTETHTSSA